jgi:hypothetical protein
MVIDAIGQIKIAARSTWVQEVSIKHEPHCYLDPQRFRPDFNHPQQLELSGDSENCSGDHSGVA